MAHRIVRSCYSLLLMHENAALAVDIWGPSLILLFAVLLIIWLIQRGWKSGFIGQWLTQAPPTALSSRNIEELSVALKGAAELNGYNVHTRSNPSVHLEQVVRFTPLEFRTCVSEIMQRFQEGNVVSIDLGQMDSHQAARLVNFCSGMTAITSGWIFRVTDNVIVLTPLK